MSISAVHTHSISWTHRNCTDFRRPPPLSPERLAAQTHLRLPKRCQSDSSTPPTPPQTPRCSPCTHLRQSLHDFARITEVSSSQKVKPDPRLWLRPCPTATNGCRGTAPERPTPAPPASPKDATGSADPPPRGTHTPTTRAPSRWLPALGPPRTCPWSAAGPSPSARTWRPGGGAGLAEGPEPDKSGPGTDRAGVTRAALKEAKRRERRRSRTPARQPGRPLLQQAGTKRKAGR